jgi:hypothetical protein
MQDFPSNSEKAKATEPPREKPQPVTSAKTGGRKKRSLGRQFKDTFFRGSARDAAEYMVTDVVVPEIRDLLYNAFQSGIDRLIYGERTGPRRRPSPLASQPLGHVDYASRSRPTRASAAQPQRTLSSQARAHHDFQDLVIPTKQEAEAVLDRMYDLLSHDGDVRVGHLYALTDVRAEHTDWKWGWTNLRGAKVVRLRNGDWLLDLPEPEALG